LKHGLRKENEFPTFDRLKPMKFKTFTGGPYQTNCFAAETPGRLILFDAPEGADEAFAGDKVGMLVLTHGHWDHVADAAAICERHGCPLLCHEETVPMVSEEDFFVRQGFPFRTRAAQVAGTLREGARQDFLGWPLDVLEVPGHCPGSLCFYSPEEGVLVGGDVLFRSGVGRWDLPGGDGELLQRGIREKIFVLPDATTVLPGHGPSTTVGDEKKTNPFVRA
jgi:glyoxylase-like metal-dependent hydrolase (beta-lactamase superfamily II)